MLFQFRLLTTRETLLKITKNFLTNHKHLSLKILGNYSSHNYLLLNECSIEIILKVFTCMCKFLRKTENILPVFSNETNSSCREDNNI